MQQIDIENNEIKEVLFAFSKDSESDLREYRLDVANELKGIVKKSYTDNLTFLQLAKDLFGNKEEMKNSLYVLKSFCNSTVSGEFYTFVKEYFPKNKYCSFEKITEFLCWQLIEKLS
jgi:hypothetical protein